MAQTEQLASQFYSAYQSYKETSLVNRRFKHGDIIPLIEQLKNSKIFTVNKVGESAEGRDINLISFGKGEKKIFLWSQMHGDEPTATAAIFDIFNFLKADDELNDFRLKLFNSASIYFLPMVNPDGAEVYQRRNIFEIDLNRDAVRLQTPEAVILKNVFDSLKAEFGFNLHDQSREYAAGKSFNPASISFLAPPPDEIKTVSEVREKSMQLIGSLYNILNQFIPGHLAKYSDEYEPRAFGDNFTKWGTSVVLLETGGWRADREKQFLRKINFVALLSSFNLIINDEYKHASTEIYNSIPQNEELMMDLILRNLTAEKDGKEYLIDIGINFEELNAGNATGYYLKAGIDDVGDLSVFYGYEDFNFSGYTVKCGKTFSKKIFEKEELGKINVSDIFIQGFTNLIVNTESWQDDFTNFPFNIVLKNAEVPQSIIKTETIPNLIISKNDKVKYAVVNGIVYEISKLKNVANNSLVYK